MYWETASVFLVRGVHRGGESGASVFERRRAASSCGAMAEQLATEAEISNVPRMQSSDQTNSLD